MIYLQGSGPGISVPFNVQHVAHIGADNVEALLQAAKDDPKLLPSFLLPEGLKEEKDEGQKMVEIDDNASKGKQAAEQGLLLNSSKVDGIHRTG